MSCYPAKVPRLVQELFRNVTWNGDSGQEDKSIYLTFDDGPNSITTEWIVDQLSSYHMKATFFMTGKHVNSLPEILELVRSAGHEVGNHGFDHTNARRMTLSQFKEDVIAGKRVVNSDLYRPPFGLLTYEQYRWVIQDNHLVYWTLMPGDFDFNISEENVVKRIIKHTCRGDILVLHDNPRFNTRLRKVLPKVLQYLNQKGFTCKPLNLSAYDDERKIL